MGMKPIEVRPLKTEELTQLDELYRRTNDVRVRGRAQMTLLGAEDKMTAPQIAKIVRQDEQTVRRWIKRFNAEGISGSETSHRCLSRAAFGSGAQATTFSGSTRLIVDLAAVG